MKTQDDSRKKAVAEFDDPRVAEAVNAYLADLQNGKRPSRQEILRQFPGLAQQLEACLDSLEFMHQVAPQLRDEPADAYEDSSEPVHTRAVLGDFRIIREIGRGGMGVVYEAEQVSLARQVALKVLPFAAVMDRKQLQRFKTEAQAAAQLHHTNIVPVHSVGCDRGVHYYAMQYIEGKTLAEVIAELRQLEKGGERRAAGREDSSFGPPWQAGDGASPPSEGGVGGGSFDLANDLASGRLAPGLPRTVDAPNQSSSGPVPSALRALPSSDTPPVAAISTDRSTKTPAFFRTVANLGIQAAEALEHAHEQGVIHRDIKPSNLLLDVRGNLWITDFGLARIETDGGLTMTGDLLGTVRYMSPEQSLAKRIVVDHRTDIYSLGVTLYELLTLRPVFPGRDRQELLRQIAFDEPRLPRRINKSIPAELQTIVLKAMSKNPAERYATAQELADDLERFLEDKPIKARRPTLRQGAAKWSRRHKPLVWSVAAAAAIVLLTVAAASTVVANRERFGRLEAERATNQIARQLAEGYLHRAQGLCEGGDVALGMLWMARSLQRAPADAPELQRVIRRNLAAWSRQLHPLSAIFEHEGGIRSLVFSPDGSRLLIGSYDGTAQLWDPAMGIPIGPPFQHEYVVEGVTMSADGSRVLTGSWDCTARLWDSDTGEPIGEPLRHDDQLRAVVFSPDGLRILTGSVDGIARVWDAETGKLIASTQQKHKSGVPVVAFSPDGSKIVTGSSDGTARLWVADTGKPVHSEPLECKSWVKAVAFSPDGSRLMTLSSDGGSTRLWDTETGKLVGQTFYNTGSVAYAAVSRDGSRYLLASSSRTARLWDVATPKALRQPLRHSYRQIWNVAFSPDGSALVTASVEGEVRVWAPTIGYAVGPALKHRDEAREVGAVAFSADGSRLLTAGRGIGGTQLWDAATGTSLGDPLPGRGPVQAFSGDGSRFLTRQGQTAQVWDVATGIPVGKPLQHKNKIGYYAALSLSPDGSRVLIGGRDRNAYLWDADTGLLARTLLHPRGMRSISPVAFSPDGSRLLTGQATTVRLWDAATGKLVGAPLEHQDKVRALAFSPDGSRILTGLMDGTAWVWDISTGKRIHGPLEHEAHIPAVAFSPDGAILLTGSLDATARFWDADTGKPIGPPLRHEAGVWAVAFSPDGSRILTGCQDGTARLWRAPPPAVKTELDQTVLWTQVITGLELDESSGEVHVLDRSSWHQSRELLEKLGGPPTSALKTLWAPPSSYDPLAWHRLMAHHRAREEQWSEAVRHLGVILNAHPLNWWDLIARGRAYAELGQWQKAAADYAKATQMAPHNWTVWRRYAETLIAVGDLAGYRSTCRTLLERFGQTKGLMAAKDITSTCTLAPKAVEDFQQPLELAQKAVDHRSPFIHERYLGGVLYRAGRFAEAVDPLKEDIAFWHRFYLPDKYTPAYSSFFLAMAYEQLGDAEEARGWLDKALRWTEQFTQQSHPDPWHRLALQLLRREAESLHTMTEAHYTRAIEEQPKDPSPWVGRARFYAYRDDFEKASADFAKAVELSPEDPKLDHSNYIIRQELAQAFNRAGRQQEAAEQWRMALEETPVPLVDYKVRMATIGKYRLYVRWAGQDGGSDSVYARIVERGDGPGGSVADWYCYRLQGAKLAWHWQGSADFEGGGVCRQDPSNRSGPSRLPESTRLGLLCVRLEQRLMPSCFSSQICPLPAAMAPTNRRALQTRSSSSRAGKSSSKRSIFRPGPRPVIAIGSWCPARIQGLAVTAISGGTGIFRSRTTDASAACHGRAYFRAVPETKRRQGAVDRDEG